MPAFIVMVSQGSGNKTDQPFGALLGSGFLPGEHQGVRFRSGSDPVSICQISGVDAAARRPNARQRRQTQWRWRRKSLATGDHARIAQYEMAIACSRRAGTN